MPSPWPTSWRCPASTCRRSRQTASTRRHRPCQRRMTRITSLRQRRSSWRPPPATPSPAAGHIASDSSPAGRPLPGRLRCTFPCSGRSCPIGCLPPSPRYSSCSDPRHLQAPPILPDCYTSHTFHSLLARTLCAPLPRPITTARQPLLHIPPTRHSTAQHSTDSTSAAAE